MTFPKYSDEEVLMREINEAELVLADLHKAGFCACLVDPTETLADRIRHLGQIAAIAVDLMAQYRMRSTPNNREIPEPFFPFSEEN